MLVAKEIMSREVISVSPELSVDKLAQLFAEKKINGAPVVDGEGRLLGVVTESDLIDQTKNVHIPTVVSLLDSLIFLGNPAKLDKDLKKMTGTTVRDIFSADLVTVGEETPLAELATIMAEKKIHTLPVVAGGELVGVIGKGDLIRAIGQGGA